MKDQTQIEERLRRLVLEALSAHMAHFDVKLPTKCRHNHRQPLDHRKTVYGDSNPSYNRITSGKGLPVAQTIGLCMYGAENPDDWKGNICEEPVDAQLCNIYNPVVSKKVLYDTFVKGVQSEEWLGKHYPGILSLVWVLGQGLHVEEQPPEEEPIEEEEPAPPTETLGLWRRICEIFNPTPLGLLVPPEPLPEPPQLPPAPEEGQPANILVYVPSLEEYEDHCSGKTADDGEDPEKS